MREAEIIEFEYRERLNAVLDQSWKIFKSQYRYDLYSKITTEAPFQHYLAQIIRAVGNLYCLDEKDLFKVDLETKSDRFDGRSKYIDITCGFINHVSCAIELKFKTSAQGDLPNGRFGVYQDLQALEFMTSEKCQKRFGFGKFYMITDSVAYITESKRGAGTTFSIHDKHLSMPCKFEFPTRRGLTTVSVDLRNSYEFEWEKIDNSYFLDLTVN